ncbi:hypothetical protein FAEPRAA2165_03231 [Faecalibacterium duncaniae]|uniref:Uncharacterized protein n=1 Tax=Faecalibacterium duncaniae (strain DSM 17677 / JCM 31915 / A2-165) TaxID=411483 RepID=C7HA76_FAED2|nr:hypothetical protein FAEPRAA2165_03231 [Faecalibacterium duncaniae]
MTKISSSRTSPDAAAEADAALDEAVDEELEPQAASTPVQQTPAISRQKFLREIFIVCFLLWYQKTSVITKKEPHACCAALP